MVQEDLRQQEDGRKCASSRNGKKPKQKKIPQRGLGVAQLEKMRVEEQQKKQALGGASSCFMFPFQSTPNSDFKPALPVPSFEFFNPLTPAPPPPPPPAPPYPSGDAGLLSMAWNGMDYSNHDPDARTLRPPLNDGATWPGFGSSQAKQLPQLQPQPPSFQVSSMASVSSSPSLSSGVHLQIEPPSNQMYPSSNSELPWPDEEKMVGMKRPWPFSLNNPPGGHAFSPCKMPPLSSSLRRWDDSSHWHDKPKFEPGATSSRDSQGPSSSSVHCNEQKPIISGKQHASLDGGFLTLAPPHAPVTPRPEQPMPNRLFQNEELSCVSYQGSIEDTKFFVDGSVQPLPPPQTGPQQERQVLLYSFLPVGPIGTSGTLSDRRGDEIEGVDLRLKL